MEMTSSQPPSTATSPLVPLATLTSGTYSPSAYPPNSYFESSCVVQPAVILPAKRIGEFQKALGELVFSQPKRKRVYPLEEGVDYTAEEIAEDGGYDPKKERKLLLRRLGRDDESTADGEAETDRVWRDPRVRSLLRPSEGNDAAASTAPARKGAVRRSRMKLSATPYALLTVEQVLRRLLPPSIEEVPSSFEIAGHIAHVNLRPESLPYKYLIGRAILDMNSPKIKMVVNKIGNIENEFRTFPMEILGGWGLDDDEDQLAAVQGLCSGDAAAAVDGGGDVGTADGEATKATSSTSIQVKIGPQHKKLMEVEVKEHGCRFHLDFARVYFNSRLQGEHDRLVRDIVREAETAASAATDEREKEKGCIVADAMAGVGPFAVPLASARAPHHPRIKVTCHANDLNPVSYEYLKKNARTNRCFSDRLMTYNLDAREFIHKMNEERVDVDHFIMNLPQLAPEFLDAFRGWKFRGDERVAETELAPAAAAKKRGHRPMIHVHCFDEKATSPDERTRVDRHARRRCETALGCPRDCLSDNEFRVHVVRDVGPRKDMLCVSFRLPFEVGAVEKLKLANGDSNDGGPPSDGIAASGSGCSRKRDRVQVGLIAEGIDSNSPKRSKESQA